MMLKNAFSQFRTRTLTRDLAIGLVLIVTITLLLIGAANYLLSVTQLEQALALQSRVLADKLAGILSLPVWTMDANTVKKIVDAYQDTENVAAIRVLDPKGDTRYEWPATETKARPINVINAQKPIEYGNELIGSVQVSISTESITRVSRNILLTTLATVFLVVSAELIATSLLLRKFLDLPLAELTQGINSIASGNYSRELQRAPQAEIDGIVLRVNAMARQIAEREEALRQSEERFRQVVTSLSDHVYLTELTTSGEWINRYLSPRLEKLVGYPTERFINDWHFWLTTVVHPADLPNTQVQIARLAGGEDSETEYRLVRSDGEIIWIRDSARVEPAGSSKLIYGVISDITERKHHEHDLEALVTVAAALRAAPTRAEMLPVIIDEALSLLAAEAALLIMPLPRTNDKVQVLARGAWADWAGTPVLFGQSATDHVLAFGQPLMRGGEPVPGIVWPEQVGESPAVACVPLLAEGRAVAALWIGRRTDLTAAELRLLMAVADIAANALHRAGVVETLERRVADRTRQLVEANEQLQELDRAKNQFVSNVSHELRAPLANIKLYLGLLDRGKPEKQIAYKETLQREHGRLAKMIEDLLDLSRLDLGVTQIQPVPADLNLLLSQLIGDRTAWAAEHQLLLDYQPDPDLPFALIDPVMLTQVITNLVANAINYTPRGGLITVLTAVREQEGQTWVTFTVQDNGLGISARDLPHLFERFYRGEVGRKASAPGTGLGLAISKEIVEKMGGRITVVSAPATERRGTSFTVWLNPAD